MDGVESSLERTVRRENAVASDDGDEETAFTRHAREARVVYPRLFQFLAASIAEVLEGTTRKVIMKQCRILIKFDANTH